MSTKIDNKLKSRDGDAKQAFHPWGSAAEAGSSRGFGSRQESETVCKKGLKRPAPCKQVAADLKATPHAADPLNEMKKKECLAERESCQCQNEFEKVSKTIKLEPKGMAKRPKEPSQTSVRNRVAKSIQK